MLSGTKIWGSGLEGAGGWSFSLVCRDTQHIFKKKRKRAPCSMLSSERDEREERTDPFEGWGT